MPKLKREGGEARATDFVESLDRGLRLLQAFGNTTGPMTLSDIARAADLPRATARRILFTLERGGFVLSDGKLFSLTPHVLTLAGSFLRSNQVVAVLQPMLDRIASAAQEIHRCRRARSKRSQAITVDEQITRFLFPVK